MRRIDRFLRRLGPGAALVLVLALGPASGWAQDGELHECGERKCGEWKPKGEKTCRPCTVVMCNDIEGGEGIVGTKKENECYEGHGAPPPEEEAE